MNGGGISQSIQMSSSSPKNTSLYSNTLTISSGKRAGNLFRENIFGGRPPQTLKLRTYPLFFGLVHTHPDIFEPATFSFRIRLPSIRIRRVRQRIREKNNPLSRVEKNKSATNVIAFNHLVICNLIDSEIGYFRFRPTCFSSWRSCLKLLLALPSKVSLTQRFETTSSFNHHLGRQMARFE